MREQESRSAFSTLIQRCYEIGNTPVWGNVKQPSRSKLRKSARSKLKNAKDRAVRFKLEGAITRGTNTPYAVDGEDFKIDGNTWIVGDMRLGASAKVSGVISPANGKKASKIIVSSSEHIDT